MINNNPSTTEHKKNIKDFLTGTAGLIFDNQETLTNGEYVELNRMIAEITIFNNRADDTYDESDDEGDDESEYESREDIHIRHHRERGEWAFKIHELERVRDILIRNKDFNFKRINKLQEEKRQLNQLVIGNNKTIYSMFLCQSVLCLIVFISRF